MVALNWSWWKSHILAPSASVCMMLSPSYYLILTDQCIYLCSFPFLDLTICSTIVRQIKRNNASNWSLCIAWIKCFLNNFKAIVRLLPLIIYFISNPFSCALFFTQSLVIILLSIEHTFSVWPWSLMAGGFLEGLSCNKYLHFQGTAILLLLPWFPSNYFLC